MVKEYRDDWTSLIGDLETPRDDMMRLVEESADILREVHPDQRPQPAALPCAPQSGSASTANAAGGRRIVLARPG